MSPEIVKPFNLAEGHYVVTKRGELMGPLTLVTGTSPEEYCTIHSPARWFKNGAPCRPHREDRIAEVITGPVGMVNFIDRLTVRADSGLDFGRQQLERARSALATMVRKSKPNNGPSVAAEPQPIGQSADSAIGAMIRNIVRDELRAVIREEIPAIVADATNFFDGSELRLAMTLRPMT